MTQIIAVREFPLDQRMEYEIEEEGNSCTEYQNA
jgi:hypothetical protein